MAHSPKKRQETRKRFVFDGLPLTQCALLAKVSESTVRRWKRDAKAEGDDWDKAKANNLFTGKSQENIVKALLTEYVTLHKATVDEVLASTEINPLDKSKTLASLADSFSKTVSAAGRAAPEVSRLGVANDVLQRLADFVIKQRDDEVSMKLAEVLESFGPVLVRHYG